MVNVAIDLARTFRLNCQEFLYSCHFVQLPITKDSLNMLANILFCSIIDACQLQLRQPYVFVSKAYVNRHSAPFIFIKYEFVLFIVHSVSFINFVLICSPNRCNILG